MSLWTPYQSRVRLGQLTERTDIPSGKGPCHTYPGYKTVYPEVVIKALEALYLEYNGAFSSLIEANKEWDEDYQFCLESGVPLNYAVQIDMAGLTDKFLSRAATLSVSEVMELLRFEIFEVENSVAVYPLLRGMFPRDPYPSHFLTRFDAVLAGIKKRHGKRPIALLAVTDDKYQAICEGEFGIVGRHPADDEVKALSGFDRLFGPDEFRAYIEQNGGTCDYLLYVRSSDPVAKLTDPSLKVDQPLLGDATMRRVIKAHSITINIDAPDMSFRRRINDTKAYMPRMGMAHPIDSVDDLQGLPFRWFLQGRGVNPEHVMMGLIPLRAKPMKGTYGCYGHISGFMDSGFPRKLRNQMSRGRGAYVVQPELPAHIVQDEDTGVQYNVIDRIFFGLIRDGKPFFLQGFRSMMPVESHEAHKGRNHGNVDTVWAEVEGGRT